MGVDFSNGSEAIPAGTVRLYMRDAKGDPKFIGEQFIGHIRPEATSASTSATRST